MAIIVDDPIVNLPFEEPSRHYRIRGGRTELLEERRPSGYIMFPQVLRIVREDVTTKVEFVGPK